MSLLLCPECGSENVTTAHVQSFMANTGEHYCHSVKTHDDNSPAHCIDCEWRGERQDLKPCAAAKAMMPIKGEEA